MTRIVDALVTATVLSIYLVIPLMTVGLFLLLVFLAVGWLEDRASK